MCCTRGREKVGVGNVLGFCWPAAKRALSDLAILLLLLELSAEVDAVPRSVEAFPTSDASLVGCDIESSVIVIDEETSLIGCDSSEIG